jgi:dipeptidase E
MDKERFIHAGWKSCLRCGAGSGVTARKGTRYGTMTQRKTILTFGGGGVTHGTDPDLDDVCFRFVPNRPSFGYIGWANGDDDTRIRRFHDRFAGDAASVSHLPAGASPAALASWLEQRDLVYFGGGKTDRLVQALGADGIWTVLRAAYDRGCVLAGVSAGGVCWYDWILSDSGGRGYRPLDGLSLVRHGVCPHYSSEADRRPRFEQALALRPGETGYGIDDGVCLVAIDGVPRGSFSARPGHAAYALRSSSDGDVTSTTVPVFEGG